MSGVFDLRDVFELVNHRFDERSFTQHSFIFGWQRRNIFLTVLRFIKQFQVLFRELQFQIERMTFVK